MEVEIKENRTLAISCSEDGMPVSLCFPCGHLQHGELKGTLLRIHTGAGKRYNKLPRESNPSIPCLLVREL